MKPEPLKLDSFLGVSRLHRQIEDLMSGQVIEARGSAHWTWEDPGTTLRYHEETDLALPGHATPLKATRDYLWLQSDDLIEVQFEDGRLFHHFYPGDQVEGTEHLCGADLYRVRYSFANWPIWTSRYRVKGPRKNTIITTRFTRS